MRSDNNQMDIVRDRPASSRDYREAATAARKNPYEGPAERERRASHYETEATKLEAMGR